MLYLVKEYILLQLMSTSETRCRVIRNSSIFAHGYCTCVHFLVEKRKVYECDITYTTNSEVGFDYLRDNMVTDVKDRVLRPLNFALVDEVDSILIDESRTPLIISGGQRDGAKLYKQADRFVKRLSEGADYVVDVKSRSVQLTEDGVSKAERTFKVNNLYDLDNSALVHHINNALKANYTMEKMWNMWFKIMKL